MHCISIQYGQPAESEAFDDYYFGTHVPLASTLPNLRKVSWSKPRGLGTDAPYLVVELWFDDGDALKTALKSPEMAATAADAAAFDVASATMFSGEVVEVDVC